MGARDDRDGGGRCALAAASAAAARAAMDGAAAGEMGEAGEAGERGIALEERADDDAASVLTHPLEGEPCDKPFVRTPHFRLATLGPSLRGPLLMHALANCFGDVISHLSTNSRGQEAVGAFLTYLVDSVPAVGPVVEALELPKDDLISKAVLLARTQSGLRQRSSRKKQKQ